MRRQLFRSMAWLISALLLLFAAAVLSLLRGQAGDIDGTEWVWLAAALVAALVLGVMGSLLVSSRFAVRVRRGGEGFEELSPIMKRLDDQRTQLKAEGSELRDTEQNLSAIIENMSEGLALLDSRGLVVAINPGAKALLGIADGESRGRHIFALCPNQTLQLAVHTALGGRRCLELMEAGGSSAELLADPVITENTVRAVVLLITDVTEKRAAEQLRREFSANVSHELKTPLTSISGYAEIMSNGIAAPEDMGRFAGIIYSESQRLIMLIDDIMKLSRLDEGGTGIEMGPVDLLDVAEAAAAPFQKAAGEQGLLFTLTGEHVTVTGSRQLLGEMTANLCDNAIKYNRPGGSVTVAVGRGRGGAPTLTVTDTGIGIPREHQGRIFERFYRVDKSHSGKRKGTGLGLSIVNHGARVHGAGIRLDSAPGRGTAIELTFPVPRS